MNSTTNGLEVYTSIPPVEKLLDTPRQTLQDEVVNGLSTAR